MKIKTKKIMRIIVLVVKKQQYVCVAQPQMALVKSGTEKKMEEKS